MICALLIMTVDTDEGAGVADCLALNRGDGIRSVVSQLAERLGDETFPDHDHRDDGGDQQNPQPHDLIRKPPDSQYKTSVERPDGGDRRAFTAVVGTA